jgi:hypothetical protein
LEPFAIYFPQFYSTSINDLNWGSGFTDWHLVSYANVTQRWSRRAPSRGFYNGADRSVQLDQIEEMKEGGLGGIALYHYWFFDRHELDSMEKTMSSTDTGFPWFLIWATESWSKRWLGSSESILQLEKDPTFEMIETHCHHLSEMFASPSYFRVNDRPLFVFYDLGHFSDPDLTVSKYRSVLMKNGIDVLFGQFVKYKEDQGFSSLVDVSFLFEPRLFFNTVSFSSNKVLAVLKKYLDRTPFLNLASRIYDSIKGGRIFGLDDYLDYLGSQSRLDYKSSFTSEVREVFNFGWDNTPRYQDRATKLPALDADSAQRILSAHIAEELPNLINAWNEWSEGAAIEPCRYLGRRYLSVIERSSSLKGENS